MRARLLPFTIFVACGALALKSADVWQDGGELVRLFGIGSVQAQGQEPPPGTPAPPAETATSTSGGSSSSASGTSTSASGSSGGGHEETSTTSASSNGPPAEGNMSEGGRGLNAGARIFSPVELDILQNLDARRKQLENWQKDIEIKENLLSGVEKRIDEKIAAIEVMKKELKEMITIYNSEQDTKIKSLVKIYESMKPRDAARIFDEVEMPILLMVVDRMSEKKAAPILAAMDPKKAKQLTVELAEARRLQNLKLRNKALTEPSAP